MKSIIVDEEKDVSEIKEVMANIFFISIKLSYFLVVTVHYKPVTKKQLLLLFAHDEHFESVYLYIRSNQ